MFAVATVFRALRDLKAIRLGFVAVATARTAGTTIVDAELDVAQRAYRLNHRRYGSL
jgi:hypothetical protein